MARRRCPVCGSKQWRKEASSGLITCSEGHVLQGYRNEIREVTEIGPHQLRKRALKSGRKKKEKQSKADPKFYHGNRGHYHYFQCLQLILWMQVQALCEIWKLPQEYEVVCRDIWALHLELLPNPPPPEPLYHQLDLGGKSQQRTTGDKGSRAVPGADSDKEAESSDSSHDDEEEDDEEMERLMQEASESPSSSEGESNTDSARAPNAKRAEKRHRRHLDVPASNIAILALACWTLRIPVMYQDFIRLVESYDLPYLDPVRLLPVNLTQHLSKYSVQSLSPYNAPTTVHLQRLTSRLAKNMHKKFNVSTPEMNALPMLWRAVRCFQGTPTLYALSKKLGVVLSIPNTLHYTLAPMLKGFKKNDPKFHKMDNVPVEVALAATVIIVLKLVYGLDGSKRHPSNEEDPAQTLPALSDVLNAIKAEEEAESRAKDALFSSTHRNSVLDFDDEEIDQYLSFCQRALLPKEERDSNTMTEYFPLSSVDTDIQRTPHRTRSETVRSMFTNSESTEGALLSPGESYTVYNARDVLGALPLEFEHVVRRAARWAGVHEDYICRVVEHFERRMRRWWVLQKKEQKMDDSDSSASDGSDEEVL